VTAEAVTPGEKPVIPEGVVGSEMAHAVLRASDIVRGRISNIDRHAALSLPA
jgi:hypothetical protein